jgi:adenine-specific DNA-methyltransferase
MSAPAGHATAAQFYTVVTPTGDKHDPPEGRCWTYTQDRFEELVAENRVYWPRNGRGKPRLKRFPWEDNGLVPFTIWPASEVGENSEAKGEIAALFGRDVIFDTPKPERLLERIIHIATDPGDLVLDCFGGSGTTAAVAHKMGRRWVTSEREDRTVSTFLRPRLERVVKGTDPGGITSVTTPAGESLPGTLKPGDAATAAKAVKTFAEAGLFADVEGLSEGALKEISKLLRDAERTETAARWSGGRWVRAGPDRPVNVRRRRRDR